MGRAARGDRLRVLMHAQHLSGVGHYVRTLAIAGALGSRHDVHLVDGGRPVPRACPAGVDLVPLPRIARGPRGIVALDAGVDAAQTLERRCARLRAVAGEIRPDVVVVEHYPFSKWELEGEILGMIDAARGARADVKVVCSVRDVLPQTRHEGCPPADYAERVIDRLEQWFDALLVHGDPSLSRLEDHFPRAADLRIAVEHTGIVAERHPSRPGAGAAVAGLIGGAPFVLASAGGGSDPGDLLGTCVDAWRLLQAGAALPGWRLAVCTGLDASAAEREALASRAGPSSGVVVMPFGHEFLELLHAARLSVSRAGYNTCADILAARCPAVLVPSPTMSDQPFRARVLEARGIAQVVDPSDLDPRRLGQALLDRLATPVPEHAIALDGAERSRVLIERLAAGPPAGAWRRGPAAASGA